MWVQVSPLHLIPLSLSLSDAGWVSIGWPGGITTFSGLYWCRGQRTASLPLPSLGGRGRASRTVRQRSSEFPTSTANRNRDDDKSFSLPLLNRHMARRTSRHDHASLSLLSLPPSQGPPVDRQWGILDPLPLSLFLFLFETLTHQPAMNILSFHLLPFFSLLCSSGVMGQGIRSTTKSPVSFFVTLSFFFFFFFSGWTVSRSVRRTSRSLPFLPPLAPAVSLLMWAASLVFPFPLFLFRFAALGP